MHTSEIKYLNFITMQENQNLIYLYAPKCAPRITKIVNILYTVYVEWNFQQCELQ
jgi:hypothetical protein